MLPRILQEEGGLDGEDLPEFVPRVSTVINITYEIASKWQFRKKATTLNLCNPLHLRGACFLTFRRRSSGGAAYFLSPSQPQGPLSMFISWMYKIPRYGRTTGFLCICMVYIVYRWVDE